jgi:purine nucleosidase
LGESLTRIILDTDLAMGAPGSDIDDGFALALALADPGLSVDLVTTVGGNSDVDTSTRLCLELLEVLCRTDVPVVRGADRPLNPAFRRLDRQIDPQADRRSGWTGGPAGPVAASEIVARVMAEPGQVTIVAIGPLTNIALALMLEPQVAKAVREIVVMGGVYLGQTNVGSMPGEYNFWCDPDAAQIVLDSGAPLRLVGLDVTQQVRLDRHDCAVLARGGRFARLAAGHTEAWIDFQERVKPREEIEQGSCALHDPLAVAAVVHPELVTWQKAHVAVERTSRITRGVAVADLLMWADPPTPNCRIATAVDAGAFRELFLERIAALP